jgi:hypothetical protein
MTAQDLTLDVRGLVTSPNPFGGAPRGGLAVADNCVTYYPGILESRRGFERHSVLANGSRLSSFQGKLISLAGTTLKYYDAGWNNLSGSYTAPAGTRMQFLEADSKLLFTTDTGIYELTAYNATPRAAGLPRATGFGVADFTDGTTTATWWTNNTQVAYRVVRARYSEPGVVDLGPPSERCVLYQTTGGNISPRIAYPLPLNAGVVAGDVFRFYRSEVSPDLATPPSDEMSLAFTITVTADDIAAGYATFVDETEESERGVALYTNATEEGIGQSNNPPPVARVMCQFRGTTIYGNTTDRYTLNLKLNGVDLNNNACIRVGDTITFTSGVNSDTYTAATAENIAAKEFKITTGVPFVRMVAMQSLARVINGTTRTVDILAYAGETGDILFEAQASAGPSIAVSFGTTTYNLAIGALEQANPNKVTVTQAGHPYGVGDTLLLASASPDPNYPVGVVTVTDVTVNTWRYAQVAPIAPPSVSAYTVARTNAAAAWTADRGLEFYNTRDPAGVMYSKTNQPGAVPLENADTVGDAGKTVVALVPLRESVLIFKEEGLYKLTGNTPDDFVIQPYDLTTVLAAPESAVAFKDNVPYLGKRGGEYAGESTGVQSLADGAVDETFLTLLAQNANLSSLAFGVSYEAEEQYLLWLPTAGESSGPISYAWVFRGDANAWTRWPVPASHAIIDPATGKLTLVNGTDVLVERKGYVSTDYQDVGGTASITAVTDSTHITMTGPGVGDRITQGIYSARVLSAAGSNLTLDTAGSWSVASADYAKAIDCQVTWLPQAGENPGTTKQFRELSLNFRLGQFSWIDVLLSTDISQTTESKRRYGRPLLPANVNVRTLMSNNTARGVMINLGFRHRQALCNFQLQSSSLIYRQVNTRTPSRGAP